MAKLPIYTQRYSVSSQKATASDFGAVQGQAMTGVGQSLSELGNTLNQIEDRRRSRQDAIDRVRTLDAFNQYADQESVRISTEEDLTNTNTSKVYGKLLDDKVTELVNNFGGSEQAKAELHTQLLTSRSNYSQNMYKSVTSAQFKAMDTHISTIVKTAADRAGDAPDTIQEQFKMIDDEVNIMSSALTPEQEQAYREGGRQQVIMSAANSYLNIGDYASADKIISGPEVAGILSPDTMRSIKSQIIVGQRQEQIAKDKFRTNLNAIELAVGRKLTNVEVQRLAGIQDPARTNPPTAAETVAAFEKAVGRPATEQEVQGIFGIAKKIGTDAESLYGSSLRGKALSRVNEGISYYASGMMPVDRQQQFEADLIEAYGPERIKDPYTGNITEVPRPVPEAVKQALIRVGKSNLLAGATDVVPGQMPQPGVETVDPGVGVSHLTTGQSSVWKDVQKIAGPQAIAEGALERTPFLGGMQQQDITMAQNRIAGIQRNVVTALQNNPKYAEGERTAIEQEVKLLSGVWSNPESARATLISVDENLQQRQDFAYKTMNDRTLPVDVRKQAANIFNMVQNVRSQFDMPPRIMDEKQYKELPDGTEYIAPDGSVRTKGARNAGK